MIEREVHQLHQLAIPGSRRRKAPNPFLHELVQKLLLLRSGIHQPVSRLWLIATHDILYLSDSDTVFVHCDQYVSAQDPTTSEGTKAARKVQPQKLNSQRIEPNGCGSILAADPGRYTLSSYRLLHPFPVDDKSQQVYLLPTDHAGLLSLQSLPPK